MSSTSPGRSASRHLNWRAGFIAALLLAFQLNISAADAYKAPRVPLPRIRNASVSIADFGVGDGTTLNTDAFAKAIAALAGKGGGRLIVPPGIWLTGPIKLRSHIELHLEPGALLKFSGDFHLYPLVVINMKGEKEVDATSPISGENLEHIAITGDGIIDGGGDAWRPVRRSKLSEPDWKLLVASGGVTNARGDTWWPSRETMAGEQLVGPLRRDGSVKLEDYEPAHQFLRPKMVRLIGCKTVLIRDVTLRNPPNWTLNPALCDDVSILNVKVLNSPAAQNSDALDLESCRRAIIRGCTFDAGDDGICLKSGKDAAGRRIGVPTENVLIEDCVVYHAHGGFTIGSEMSGGIRNIRVRNCTFIGTDVGLRFKSTRGRGGVVENIDIANVRMADVPGDAVNFNLYYGGRSPLEDSDSTNEVAVPSVTEATPQFRAIHLENILCRGAQRAIVLQGLPEMPARDITLTNVDIAARQGVFLTDVDGVRFDHVRVKTEIGPPLRMIRVENSSVELQ